MHFSQHWQEFVFRLHGYRIRHVPLRHYVERLDRGHPFSFSRFGDGEWNAMFGVAGCNCDGHAYFPSLGRDLIEAVCHPKSYLYALQPYALKRLRKPIATFLKAHDVALDWHNAEVFHDANKQGRLYPFIEALRRKPVVIVGPDYLRSLPDQLFPIHAFVEVPRHNCYLARDRIQSELLALGQSGKSLVYAFSASMAANVMIHHLYESLGDRHWLLDLGSLWDVYAGEKTRSVYRKHDWTARIAKNTGHRAP